MMTEVVPLTPSFFGLPCLGAIGVEELEEPLLALGLVNSREEVVALMSKVDKDN